MAVMETHTEHVSHDLLPVNLARYPDVQKVFVVLLVKDPKAIVLSLMWSDAVN